MNEIYLDRRYLVGGTGIGQDTKNFASFFEDRYPICEKQIQRWNFSSLTIQEYEIFNHPTLKASLIIDMQINLLHNLRKFNSGKIRAVRVHDLFPKSNPEWFTLRSRLSFNLGLINLQHHYDYFLCNSVFTANELLKTYPSIKERIRIIPCAESIDTKDALCNRCKGCEHLRINADSFFLAVGTIEPRKNYEKLLSFWETYKPRNQLIIVGKYGWKSESVRKKLQDSSNGVKWLEYVCTPSLKHLYESANGLISFSHEEGFNIPALEASKKRIPILLSRNSTHTEIYSQGAYFLDNDEDFTNFIMKFGKEKIDSEIFDYRCDFEDSLEKFLALLS